MSDTNFLNFVLSELDIAVLKRVAENKYTLVGDAPDYYYQLYSDIHAPWKESDFLEYFLDSVEEFFNNDRYGYTLSSGFWQEKGIDGNFALRAYALKKENLNAIVIRRFGDEYIEQQYMMQKARENMLEKRDLRFAASYDELTGLYNKSTFLRAFKSLLENTEFLKSSLTVLMLDIDDFKAINDTYGHLAGDRVLSEFGKLLTSSVRSSDLLARYGGEEFIIAAPNTLEQALSLADKICTTIAEHDFKLPVRITASIGCAVYQREDSTDSIINRADKAMYDAKVAGKNTCRAR